MMKKMIADSEHPNAESYEHYDRVSCFQWNPFMKCSSFLVGSCWFSLVLVDFFKNKALQTMVGLSSFLNIALPGRHPG